ncbi:Papain-like cysteine protease AvrRpt2 [Mycobacterium lentiflavum]|uniref:Papain-like cysteine protease AvrRpt2 n=1 Tax=Mycobacterium lentiflavum TaxID=141349 RepID=A0A0E4CND9_MYCLN|nr:hypothetical protein [Mycobacterium lentiflavum]MEE3066083.1 hypothetical protein [Actinomycetota bacterium]ULP44705.1 hypothetical protein MJO58_12795 [Mycobacterium lentiflavum]CQD13745.1 Papain-like cysteine protease AvrRpt2 [Mycobacterium lentiflavum]
MARTLTTRAATAALLWATAATSVGWATAAHATPGPPAPDADHEATMYGDPTAAAAHWRRQHSSDCGEIAVADVVGELTGRQPTEWQITAVAENTLGATGSKPIWNPPGNTDIRDLPPLLWHYWVRADNIQTNVAALQQNLADRRRVIALVNAETIWNHPGNRDVGNHFVVVTGIDTKAGVVHLNDSGIDSGRDEQIPIATFERAWAPNHNSAVVTRL